MKSTFMLIFFTLISAPSFAAPSCKDLLTDYLRHAEHFAWWRYNLDADDKLANPLLSIAEQQLRMNAESNALISSYSQLKKNCFPAIDQNPKCLVAWREIEDDSYHIGAALSRLDTVDRNPVPKEYAFRSENMRTEMSRAVGTVFNWRLIRNRHLEDLVWSCMDRTTAPSIEEQYFLKEVEISTNEIFSDLMAKGQAPSSTNLSVGRFQCEMAYTDPEFLTYDEMTGRLSIDLFDVTLQNNLWTFKGSSEHDRGMDFTFQEQNGVFVARNEKNHTRAYLRIAQDGTVIMEFVNGAQANYPTKPVSDPSSKEDVFGYWACRPYH